MENCNFLKGGEFLTKDVDEIFIPEEFNEEQKMIADMCHDFLDKEVFPVLDKIDGMEPGLMRSLISKAGELGILGVSIPEEYMGFGQSFVTSMIASEVIGGGFSFAVAYSAHTGIGTLPILYYGSPDQKEKYLPKLATGEWAAAYCLTEPNAGSDANSGKTRAILSPDGKNYILNGQKMWITNGGFADVLTVFAKIDNDKILSAFIVEKNFPGVTFNTEEKKMGIKGSSTVQIFFNDCVVPVENLLGKRGEGFRIALNILHIGRLKLGANVIGGNKRAILYSVNYANERKQFNNLISSFGAIKYKLAEQVILSFVIESTVYRASKYVDDTIQMHVDQGMDKGKAYLEAIGEYAMEAAIIKVLGSEVLDYIVDEAVQIHGGMGFSAEMPVDRCYRDSRINRIFEGTNEINRLVVADSLTKCAKKSESPIFAEAKKIYDSINQIDVVLNNGNEFEYYQKVTSAFKKAALLVMSRAYETLGKIYSSEQEVMMHVSDMLIKTYAAESTVLRVKKLIENNIKSNELYKDIMKIYVYEAAASIYKSGCDAISSFATPDDYPILKQALIKFTTVDQVNIMLGRRKIAAKLIEDNRYDF